MQTFSYMPFFDQESGTSVAWQSEAARETLTDAPWRRKRSYENRTPKLDPVPYLARMFTSPCEPSCPIVVDPRILQAMQLIDEPSCAGMALPAASSSRWCRLCFHEEQCAVCQSGCKCRAFRYTSEPEQALPHSGFPATVCAFATAFRTGSSPKQLRCSPAVSECVPSLA